MAYRNKIVERSNQLENNQELFREDEDLSKTLFLVADNEILSVWNNERRGV